MATQKPTPEQLTKLQEGYRYVTIPAKDMLDYPMTSIWINRDEYKPGMTHLLRGDIADELERILAKFQESTWRLMRNKPHAESSKQAGISMPPPEDISFSG